MALTINAWAVLLMFVSSLVVGSIWYAKPLFGKSWMKMVGLTDKKAREGSDLAFAKMIPFALLQAYFVAFATSVASAFYTDRSWLSIALLAGHVFVGGAISGVCHA